MQELSDYSFLLSRFTNIVVKPISSQQPQATSLLQVSICQGIPRSALRAHVDSKRNESRRLISYSSCKQISWRWSNSISYVSSLDESLPPIKRSKGYDSQSSLRSELLLRALNRISYPRKPISEAFLNRLELIIGSCSVPQQTSEVIILIKGFLP